MLTIRFNRVGKKNKTQFRIVVQEHTIAPGGRHVDIVGSWDPHSKKGTFKEDRIKHWIKEGVQISDSVYNLLVRQEIISGEKRPIKIRDKKKEKADAEPTSAESDSSADKAVDDKKKEPASSADKPATETKEDKKDDKKAEGSEPVESKEKPAEDKPKEDK